MVTFFKTIFVFLLGKWINLLQFVARKESARLAYKYFSEPREGSYLQKQTPFILTTAKRYILSYENHTFPLYNWENQGKKSILLVHGWESNAARWEFFLPFLTTNYNVFALDAPAHGMASGKEFNAVLYSQFIQIVHKNHPFDYLIGHSMGGMASYYFTYNNPNSGLFKLVLLGAPAELNLLIQNYAKILNLNTGVLNHLEAYFVAQFKFKFRQFSIAQFGSNILLPTFIAHDKEDDVVLFAEAEKLNKAIKNSILYQTTGLGHSLHDEKLYEKLVAFLEV
jgi:pimeloyl-ACP methyl ester carboxylesterase